MDARAPIEELLVHREWMRGLARTLALDESRADDVVQETWLSALRNPPREPATVRGWLATVMRNHARKAARGERRRGAREAALALRPDAPSPEETLARAQT